MRTTRLCQEPGLSVEQGMQVGDVQPTTTQQNLPRGHVMRTSSDTKLQMLAVGQLRR